MSHEEAKKKKQCTDAFKNARITSAGMRPISHFKHVFDLVTDKDLGVESGLRARPFTLGSSLIKPQPSAAMKATE